MRKKFFLPKNQTGDAKPQFGVNKPWLAPMAGYSDLPFRVLCGELGAATCVTEMISARGILYKSPGTGELLKSVPQDQALVVQLFGDDPECMGEAVHILAQAGYLWFDCNLGCPARKVLRQNCGAKLLVDTERVLRVARAMLDALAANAGSDGGIGFKLRLGISPSEPADPDLPLRLEDAGAAWITLHPRYASQGYGGVADWTKIRNLAERLFIPVLGSGDLLTARAAMKCLEMTGANGVMYARGALADPYIFTRHMALWRGEAEPAFNHEMLKKIIERHVLLSRELCPDERVIYKMRSLIPRYVRFLPGVHKLRLALCQCENWEKLFEILNDFMENSGSAAEVKTS